MNEDEFRTRAEEIMTNGEELETQVEQLRSLIDKVRDSDEFDHRLVLIEMETFDEWVFKDEERLDELLGL